MEINGYPNYLIYEDGRVWSKTRKIFLKQQKNMGGYLQLRICKNNKYKDFLIHRLIAIHYIPNDNNYPQIDHIDRNKLNNNISNLRWCDSKINNNNKCKLSKTNTGEKYITKCEKRKNQFSYYIKKSGFFQTSISCSKHTLQDAIKLRDELLIEYNIVEPSV
jgi:hypothetical protein